jgi:hypothetical protein
MKYYKIVRVITRSNKTKHVSAFTKGDACVEYKPFQWVSPHDWLKNYGLWVYTDYLSATVCRDYLQLPNTTLAIWECEIKNRLETIPCFFGRYMEDKTDILNYIKSKRDSRHKEYRPDSSVVFATAVKITNRLSITRVE